VPLWMADMRGVLQLTLWQSEKASRSAMSWYRAVGDLRPYANATYTLVVDRYLQKQV